MRFSHRTRRVWLASYQYSWAAADQVVVSGGNFIITVLLARLLGIGEFGQFVLAWGVVLFVQNIQYSAIGTAMLSLGPKQDPETAPSYYGSLFLQAGVFAVVTAFLTWIGSRFAVLIFPTVELDLIALAVVAAVLSVQVQDFLRRYFFSIGRPEITFASDVLRYTTQIAGLVLLFAATGKNTLNSEMALWMAAGTSALTSLATLRYVQPLEFVYATLGQSARAQWHFSKWLVSSSLLAWTIAYLFLVATGILLGSAAVGGVRAAQNLVGVGRIVIEACANIVPARASRGFINGGEVALNAYLKRVSIYGAMGILVATGIFAVTPEFWLSLLFGEEFRPYGSLVRWWVLVEVVIFLGLITSTWLRTHEDTEAIFGACGVSALVAFALAFPLITKLGVVGVVVGILIVFVVQLIWMAAMIARRRTKQRASWI